MIQSIACVLLALVVLAVPRGVEGKPADDRPFCLARARPVVDVSVRPRVAFEGAGTQMSWTTRCASCATLSERVTYDHVVEDLRQRSGTRYLFTEGMDSGERPECEASTLDLVGKATMRAIEGPGEYEWTIEAQDRNGVSNTGTVLAAFLPRPVLDVCSSARSAGIEQALTAIYRRLLEGCIRDDVGLDVVPAFDDGHLGRLAFYLRLKGELQNVGLITFGCNDVKDNGWQDARWREFGNRIDLYWSPRHAPDLPYAILHELIRKVGFNGDLPYTPDFIQGQIEAVTAACR